MSKGNNKYDNKSIIVSTIIVAVAAAALFFYWDTTKYIMRCVLEARFTYFLIWVVTVVIFVTHYIRLKSKDVTSETIITKKFGAFADNALGGIGYATSITTAMTLLKGLFIQTFFTDKQFFFEFNSLDLITVFGVMMFLLFYAVMKVVDIAKEGYQAQWTEQVLTENRVEVSQDGHNNNED